MEYTFLQNENLKTLQNFYNDPNQKICFIKGNTGFFKTTLVKESIQDYSNSFLVFNVKCFDSTSLDDIFLSIFNDIKTYAQQKKLSFSKIETDSFALRINQYLKQIKQPAIIIFDSLQNIFNKQNEKEKEEITNFIKYVSTAHKFKIVLISSFFPKSITDIVQNTTFGTTTIETMPLTENETKAFLEQEKINFSDSTFKQFYELSYGNPYLIKLATNIITTTKTTPESLLNSYKYKSISFEEFLIQRLLTFIPDKAKESLKALSLFNGGLPIDFLVQENFFTNDQINYLLEKSLLNFEYNLIYTKSCIKKVIKKTISQIDKTKIHTLWKNFYDSQLPLKPNERIIQISRNTMRAQIEYHKKNINNNLTIEKENKQNVSLLSYLNSNLTDWNIKNSIQENENKNKRPTPPSQSQNNGLEKYELTQNELALLGAPIDLNKKDSKNVNLSRTKEQQEEHNVVKEKNLNDILALAEKEFQQHNFELATAIYLKALEQNNDATFKEKYPDILYALAVCCKKLNKTTETLNFYNKLSEFYTQHNNLLKLNEIKLQIAKIYKETYRIGHAKVIYENLINNKNTDEKAQFQAYIELAEIEDNSANIDKSTEYYKKAFELIPQNSQTDYTEILQEAYFKYALIMDDLHQTQEALAFYEKCIKISTTPNIYASSSYSNAAELLKDLNNNEKALEYYKEALKNDIAIENNEGIYYICLKLALNTHTTNNEEKLNWLTKSLNAAKRTKENLYITNAYIEIGDYYNKINEPQKALKSYLQAKNTYHKTNENTTEATNPDSRIEYLKKIIPKELFEKTENEVNKNE